MKKIILTLIIFSFTLLVGCTLGNTPTSRVEDFLSKHQMLDDDIAIDYTDLTNDAGIDQDLKTRYEEAIQHQYQDMTYEVKEEAIDGETATVTVQIEVMNYKQAFAKYNKNDYELKKYHELVLDELENTKEMITYTIDFTLTKNDDDTWTVDELSTEDKQKLLGIN